MSPETMMGRVREILEKHWRVRPDDLRRLDLTPDVNPDWFLSQDMVGYIFYIDKFAGRLRDLPTRIPYLQKLGVTYAHMTPCLLPCEGQSDGGYAVKDYRRIDPDLGSMSDFQTANRSLRDAGISPCIDLVLNHTAKERDWAQKARGGDPFYQAFYRMFDDDTLPKQYEQSLVEIFPAQAPENFTYYPDMGKLVWTTFNEYQWDLNWENPEVFLAILDTFKKRPQHLQSHFKRFSPRNSLLVDAVQANVEGLETLFRVDQQAGRLNLIVSRYQCQPDLADAALLPVRGLNIDRDKPICVLQQINGILKIRHGSAACFDHDCAPICAQTK